MRIEFEMTEDEYDAVHNPIPFVSDLTPLGTIAPRNAIKAAWQQLAKKLKFKLDTVQIVRGTGARVFTAEVSALWKKKTLDFLLTEKCK